MRRLLPYITLVLCLSLVAGQAQAQTRIIDSLKTLVNSHTGSSQIDHLNTLAKEYFAIDTDTAFSLASRALTQAENSGYWQGSSNALNNLGAILRERGDVRNAEVYFRRALTITEQHPNTSEWCRDNLSMADILYLEGHYAEGISHINRSLAYYESTHDEAMQDFCYRLLGSIFSEQGYYEKAFFSFQKSYAIASWTIDPIGSHSSPFMWNCTLMGDLYRDAGDSGTALQFYRASLRRADQNKSLVDSYKLLAAIARLNNQNDSAIAYYQKEAYFIRKRIPDSVIARTFLTEPLMNIAEMHLAKQNYQASLDRLQNLRDFIEHMHMNIYQLRLWKDLSASYLGLNDQKNALIYANKLLDRARSTGTRQYVRDAFELQWKIYDARHDTNSAYRSHILFTEVQDSIARDIQLRNIAVSQMKLWTEKQGAEIKLLQKDKKIKGQQAQMLLYSLITMILLALIVFWIFLLKRRNALNRARHLEDVLKLQELEARTIKMEFENKTSELEMQALRAQMNPHFIFNTLNAINRFILEKDRVQASAYLTRFSRLVRMILQNSQEELIPLESELEALRLYLELESLRFDHYFSYEIVVSPELDTSTLQIAPLIIQPFAENAIWHGLMHKGEGGSLTITFNIEDDVLVCRIADDGIGRKRAAELKSKSVSSHKSMGMRLTSDRIDCMMMHSAVENPVQIKDLILADGTAGGTEVTLKIPVIYD